MTEFAESRWADTEFSQSFRNDADIYLPMRKEVLSLVLSFYDSFISIKKEAAVLDLGCGDGLFADLLLQAHPEARLTLVDGSEEMLRAAEKRLEKNRNVTFIRASFQELLHNKSLHQGYDLIYSSLAIHHLPFHLKRKLYDYIYYLLTIGGNFVHYDVVLPPEKTESWYLAFWRQWIEQHPDTNKAEPLLDIPQQYKENQDNTPDSLEAQLNALREIGFIDVDCYFKYGIFALFGGGK